MSVKNFYQLKTSFKFRYETLNTTYLGCKLQGVTVALFNATILVSEDNGRSLTVPSAFFVTPGQLIYNFQTYAR